MKTGTPSRTAQYMALFRAIENVQSPDKRLFTDPFAIGFLDKKLQRVVRMASWPLIGGVIPRIIHRKGIGAISSGIARTKYIDDLLAKEIRKGCRQIIILGAGFDSRPIRLGFLKNATIIEIDHPDTSNYKLEVLKHSLDRLPDHIRFHQADFNKQSLDEIAAEAGISFSLPTTILWEGVSNYLSEEAVSSTFAFTRQFAPPFSIIFTYIHKDVLDNPHHFKGTKKLFQNLRQNEERWSFGFYPQQLPSFLAQYGLDVKEDLNATQYREKYMPGRKYFLEGYEFYRVVYALKNRQHE